MVGLRPVFRLLLRFGFLIIDLFLKRFFKAAPEPPLVFVAPLGRIIVGHAAKIAQRRYVTRREKGLQGEGCPSKI
jgi:hypothetical protein